MHSNLVPLAFSSKGRERERETDRRGMFYIYKDNACDLQKYGVMRGKRGNNCII